MLSILFAAVSVSVGFGLVLSGAARRYIRRLRWLVAMAGLCAACGTIQSVVPGHVVDKPGLVEAQALIWREAYGRTDASPLVYIVEGDALTCTSPGSGKPGFECPTVGCREGCTSLPVAVSLVADGRWSETVLAHEDMHALKIRNAIAVMRYTPGPAAMQLLQDRDHKGPEWQPAGEVDKANALLARHGL